MSGIDRLGPGKKPTGPLPVGNGAAPAAAAGQGAAAKPAGGSKGDSVAASVKGEKSTIPASDDMPRAEDAAALPAEVAAYQSNSPQALARLLDGGAPFKFKGSQREISGAALNRLKAQVEIGDQTRLVSPADLGLIRIAKGA
jgi:hypothetical protein